MKTQVKYSFEIDDAHVNNGYCIYRFKDFSGCVQIWNQDEHKNQKVKLIEAAPELLEALECALPMITDDFIRNKMIRAIEKTTK